MMDNTQINKKRRRPYRNRNLPPPIFTQDRPPANNPNIPFPNMPHVASNAPMNSIEMIDRFNQLLNWSIPPNNNFGQSVGSQNVGYADIDDRNFSPTPHAGRNFYPPRGDRNFSAAPRGDRHFSAPHGDRNFSPPREDLNYGLPRGDRNFSTPRDDRNFSAPRDDRNFSTPRDDRHFPAPRDEPNFSAPRNDRNFSTPRDDRNFSPHREEMYHGQQPGLLGKRRFDPSDLRNRLDQQSKRYRPSHERDNLATSLGGLSGIAPRCDVDDRNSPFFDNGRLRGPQSDDNFGRLADCRPDIFDNRPEGMFNDNSREGPSVFNEPPDCWADGNVGVSRDRWSADFLETGRQVKEYWPDRRPDPDTISYQGGDVWQRRSPDRDNFNRGRMDDHEERRGFYVRQHDMMKSNFQQSDINDRFVDERIGSQRSERESGEGFNRRGDKIGLPGPSYGRGKSPVREGEKNRPFSPVADRPPNEQDPDELTVLIHKPNCARYTFPEADTLRSNLIDLVMSSGSQEEEMPEFVNSGLKRGGLGFYVQCRTKKTLDWLLKQKLAPLNGVELTIRRNKVSEIVKISSFAPRCTRSREETEKLIKLQNAKKGFNFNDWTLRSFQAGPRGVFLAFDITVDEARVLKQLNCQLSFELKTLTFRISHNPEPIGHPGPFPP